MRPFYFIHIGKTGGMSIRKALSEAAIVSGIGKDEILIHRTHELKRRKGKKIVAGHMPWDTEKELDALRFTVLREPAARYVSRAYFCMRRIRLGYAKPWKDRLTKEQIEEICSWGTVPHVEAIPRDIMDIFRSVDNQMTKSLGGDKAYHNLENWFDAFGITERMDKTEEVLNSIWPHSAPVKIGRHNAGPAMPAPSADFMDKIRDHNRDDVKLYSFAVNLFKDRYE